MCCIFTCCGWMIDLIQRLWTFTMSCCISSAVCCALVTAAMSGIALGYNYSLAEYIDLKETNVSVYLKRGVFDDEIADDMDWRRSGHMPVQGHLKDSNLVTGEPVGPDEMPLRSGRRMDDSLIVSDDQHKFEGSLMRLTARPPDARPSPAEPVNSDVETREILMKYPAGSLEQMKALHGLMNLRRSGSSGNQRHTASTPSSFTKVYVETDAQGKIVMPYTDSNYASKIQDLLPTHNRFNPARLAVPDQAIGEPARWFIPKGQIPPSYKSSLNFEEYDNEPSTKQTYPQPIRMTTEIWRPTIPIPQRTTLAQLAKPKDILGNQDTLILGSNLDRLKNKIIMEKIDIPGPNRQQPKESSSGIEFKSEDEYEDEAMKGLPTRIKRAKRNVANDVRHNSDTTFTNTLIEKIKIDRHNTQTASTNILTEKFANGNNNKIIESVIINKLKSLSLGHTIR